MLPAITVYTDFRDASQHVLKYLNDRIPMGLWMVTRTHGEDWIILQAMDQAYGVRDGQVLRWSDSFCSRMVQELGPNIAPDSDLVPAYADAPIRKQLNIRAYVGVPLKAEDGGVFGTLCAIDPATRPQAIEKELPLIELLASLLSTVLASEMAEQHAVREAEKERVQALRDELSGLFNRRAWNEFIAMEEVRCKRYGHPACVLSIDLNGLKKVSDTFGHAAGDAFISRAAHALTSAARNSDIVARVGGDEFMVLATECDLAKGCDVVGRFRKCLDQAGVSAAIGIAARVPSLGLIQAAQEADAAMYQDKFSIPQVRREAV